MLCDLHTHTTASDGQYTPAALAALELKLDWLLDETPREDIV